MLVPTLALAGEIAADPDRTAVVATPVPGRLDSIAFKEGERVKKGDTLARVAVTEVAKLRAAHNAAVARATAARADANRLRTLVAQNLRPEQELLNADAAANAAEADARGLAAQLNVLGAGASSSLLGLLAPLDGVVLTRRAVVGGPVSAADPVATIADLSSAWFVARVFERDLSRARTGAAVSVVLDAYPDRPVAGVVEAVSNRIDPHNRSVEVRVRVTDPANLLKVGLYGTAHVETEGAPRSPVLTVPRTAVIDVAGRKVAFVRAGDGYELRNVTLGASDRERLEILSGLSEGDEVVTEGAFSLKSIVLRSTLSEG